MSSNVRTLYRLPFSTSEHRKLGEVYEGETNICKFVCVIIHMTVMWIVGSMEFKYAEYKLYTRIWRTGCISP
jgi:hypothetical protein